MSKGKTREILFTKKFQKDYKRELKGQQLRAGALET